MSKRPGIRWQAILLVVWIVPLQPGRADHHPGEKCYSCHSSLAVAGTFFRDSTGTTTLPGMPVVLTDSAGSVVVLENTDPHGNVVSHIAPNGRYLIAVGAARSRSWHTLPAQGDCNSCHTGTGTGRRSSMRRLPALHTRLPYDNDCRHCHHFPASMSFAELVPGGVLFELRTPPYVPGSRVEIGGIAYPFDPSADSVASHRPDIFVPGHFSMFDAIIATAKGHGIPVEYSYDPARKTHFINRVNGIPGNYWYHFSYDAGSGNSQEIQYRRANRWDEALWRPGVWVRLVEGEAVDSLKAEFLEEIVRETSAGHVVPRVQISLNPTAYQGNPSGSGRITVTRTFLNVAVAPHNMRAAASPAPFSNPFQSGVTTAMDVLLSLRDQGSLDLVTAMFYTYFGGHYINSYYVVAMGFPGAGVAHASGRQGFTYTTENGTPARLPNQADRKQHITSDILVIHAPDFASWQWTELGSPYYEAADPTVTGVLRESMEEDDRARERGFNLHAPYPNPFNGSLSFSFNIFEPAEVSVSVHTVEGQRVTTLFEGRLANLGVHHSTWTPVGIASGIYYLVMKYGSALQVRRVSYLR